VAWLNSLFAGDDATQDESGASQWSRQPFRGQDCGDGGEEELESAQKAVVEAEEGPSRRNNRHHKSRLWPMCLLEDFAFGKVWM
jgi:hypothetical protein